MNDNSKIIAKAYCGDTSFFKDDKIILTNSADEYVLLEDKHSKYRVMEMLCEYARVEPYTLMMESIRNCPLYDRDITFDNIKDAISYMQDDLSQKIGYATARVFIHNHREGFRISMFNLMADQKSVVNEGDFEITENFFAKVPSINLYLGREIDHIGQLFVIALAISSPLFDDLDEFVKRSVELFDRDIDDEDYRNARLERIMNTHVQYSDDTFDIKTIDGKPSIVYEFSNFCMIAKLEVANAINSGIKTCKCKNCGHFFPVYGRSDSIYCTYEAPGHPGKTCREIGAQVTRAKKEKEDVLTREYRREYLRLKMQERRHPEDDEILKQLMSLGEAYQLVRNGVKDSGGENQYFDWLIQFDNGIQVSCESKRTNDNPANGG